MDPMEPLDLFRKNKSLLEAKIGHTFAHPSLLQAAFLHKSYCNEQRRTDLEHNERLEFLGDAILSVIVSDFLYREFPQRPEGELSDLRSRLVETATLSSHTEKLGLMPFLVMGRGEQKNSRKESIQANLFEALLGALYLDGGLAVARTFLFAHFEEEMKALIAAPSRNWKAILQDYAQRKLQSKPEYVIQDEEGPDHEKTFHITVLIEGEVMGQGTGPSKKEAEREAAAVASKKLGLVTL
jgi:ribonuclease-3